MSRDGDDNVVQLIVGAVGLRPGAVPFIVAIRWADGHRCAIGPVYARSAEEAARLVRNRGAVVVGARATRQRGAA